MTIERIGAEKVLIVLGSRDMQDFSLEYSKLGFEDAHSRRILTRLLALACTKTGIETEGRRLLVEALPHKSGCLLLVTLRKKEGRRFYRVKKSTKLLCCVLESSDSLMDAAAAVCERHRLPKNSAYFCDGKYYLIVRGAVSLFALAALGEFGDCYVCSPVAAARIAENGRVIAEGNAVERIGASQHSKKKGSFG